MTFPDWGVFKCPKEKWCILAKGHRGHCTPWK